MTPENDEEDPQVLTARLVELIHAKRGHMLPSQRIEGMIAVAARSRPKWRGLPRKGPILAALALGVAVAVGVTTMRAGRLAARPLSYVVDGGNVAGGGLIESAPADEPKVRFSDSSEVYFARGSVVSLRSVDDHGARLSLIEGHGHADVMHAANARWLFDVGPFLITVTGTAFTFGWTAADERLDVKMERGTVEVSGPLSDGAITLRSGQHLTVRVRERETVIRDVDDPGPAPWMPAAPPQSAPDPSAVQAAALAEMPGLAAPATPASKVRARATPESDNGSWPTLLASGGFDTIVRQAEQKGLENCLATASSADLAALADAFRYSRHDAEATRALLAQRRRFPASKAAEDATFLLGRLEETKHDARAALGWYDRYLAESTNGAYVSEALGRRMLLTQQTEGDEAARALATQYLARFPQGTYAARSRALVQGP